MATITETKDISPKFLLMQATELEVDSGLHGLFTDNDGLLADTTVVRTGEATLAVTHTIGGELQGETGEEWSFSDVADLALQGIMYGVPRELMPLDNEFIRTHGGRSTLDVLATIGIEFD